MDKEVSRLTAGAFWRCARDKRLGPRAVCCQRHHNCYYCSQLESDIYDIISIF